MMHANGNGVHHGEIQIPAFPEAHMSLREADEEMFGLIELEKVRQW